MLQNIDKLKDINANDDDTNQQLILQIKEFDKLKAIILRYQKQQSNNTESPQDIKCIKTEPV